MYFYAKPDGRAVIFARPDKGPEEPTSPEMPNCINNRKNYGAMAYDDYDRTSSRVSPCSS
ncbi:MAG: hypothetical protein U5K00_08060 [Melioribacteraceae bacterium]|nr:hypothetical protein [Melioribacteraceae bacterium]